MWHNKLIDKNKQITLRHKLEISKNIFPQLGVTFALRHIFKDNSGDLVAKSFRKRRLNWNHLSQVTFPALPGVNCRIKSNWLRLAESLVSNLEYRNILNLVLSLMWRFGIKDCIFGMGSRVQDHACMVRSGSWPRTVTMNTDIDPFVCHFIYKCQHSRMPGFTTAFEFIQAASELDVIDKFKNS